MSDHQKESIILLGSARMAHGIKGGVNLNLINRIDSVLHAGMEILLYPHPFKEGAQLLIKLTISEISFGNKTIAYFEGISTRNDIEAILPFDIALPRSNFPDSLCAEGEYYIADLIGLEVFHYPDGEKLGKISRFYENGAQQVLVIERLNDRGIWELPFVEVFFPVVDLIHRRVEIVPPEFVE